MLRGEFFSGVARRAASRPLLTVALVCVLALAAAALALRLQPSAGVETLVDSGSEEYKATERFKQQFGDEPVVILVKGDLQRTILTPDILKVTALEGCLAGNVPDEGLAGLPPVCRELAKLHPAKVVYGPGTFINTAATQIAGGFQERSQQQLKQAEEAAKAAKAASKKRGDPPAKQNELANAARELVMSQFVNDSLKLAVRYGLTGIPRVDDPDFVSQLVFDPKQGVCVPKARFSYLFPSCEGALVLVRLRPNLSEAERERALDLINLAVKEKGFQPERGAKYVVSGVPAVIDGLSDAVQDAIFVLLGAALLVMAGTLLVVFKSRMRLLPLALALGAAGLAFGAVSLAGGSLTMASIAALPVLIGLAVDYAIQFQARFDERRRETAEPPPPEVAAADAALVGGPTIAAAGLSTAVGFLVLLLSPIPMVRGFAVLLVIGIALAIACTLTAGMAALTLYWRREPARLEAPPVLPRARERLRRTGAWIAGSLPGRWVARRGRGAMARAQRIVDLGVARPKKVLAIGAMLAALGWVADTQTEVVSDVRELVPQDLQALKDVNELQEVTGVSGEIDVMVRGEDVTSPAALKWMTEFQQEVLQEHGYRPGARCAQERNPPELCPALSLPDLFRTSGVPNPETVRTLLAAVPSYFSQAVISQDRKTANLAFGIRLMPLDQQKEVLDDIRERMDPPPGIQASLTGLPVLAAEANADLSSTLRRALTLLAALLAVFAVLYLVRRNTREAAIPLIPIALATGWSALVLFLLRIPLNPMSATLGALVIAISTEFSVLLSARYKEERAAGSDPADAIDRAYASTGAAVLASGATAIAGFAALIASDIRMLRDFGAVTVVDLTVSLVGVMLVLPAALVWAEQHGPFKLADLDPRRLFRGRKLRLPRPAARLRAMRRRRA